MAPLPLIKIGAVLWKELSKPLAAQIKLYAQTHPRFRAAAMSLGRAHELASQRVESAWAGRGLLPAPRPVGDSTAFTVGTDLLSQGFMLSTAIGIVWLEYYRADQQKALEGADKAARKAAKNALREERTLDMERSIADLQARVALDELELADLREQLRAARRAAQLA